METVTHTFEPVYDRNSRVLILGTMPSPKSREYGFYYGHPQNSFWRVLSSVFEAPLPNSVGDKIQFLLENNIAVWDVLKSCDISGANDSSIKNPVANDFGEVLSNSQIETVFTTGSKATSLYTKYCLVKTGIPTIYLPSTSPANRRIKFGALVDAYGIVREAIHRYSLLT